MTTTRRVRRLARKASTRSRRALLTPFLRIEPDPSLVRLGSPVCGWWVPADVVRTGAVAYCAGAGEDVTFDLELHRRGMHVVTIDPTPRAIAHVATVDPGDDRFTFVPSGLWHEPDVLTFYAPADAADVSHSALNLQRTGAAHAFTARVDTVDALMAEQGHRHVDLLKVDIEGAESTVLPHLLREGGPRPDVVCFEYDQPQSSLRLLRLLAMFRSRGYVLVHREKWNFTLRRTGTTPPTARTTAAPDIRRRAARASFALRSTVKDSRALRTVLFSVQNLVVAARSGMHAAPNPARATSTPPVGLAAMVRVKDEARFLPEWLAHHLNLGFEHVFVYDNNSTDGIEDVIAPFVERGLVTYVPWPPVPASPASELDFLERFGPRCRWVAFFDADEFLVENGPGELAAVLRDHERRPAVAVCWRYFGSAGHLTIPRGLVTERFDRAAAVYNRHVKVIAQPAEITRPRNSHSFYYRRGRLAVTPGGDRVFGSFVVPPQTPRLELRHYVYRSREDYERKTRRGYVDAQSARDKARNLEVADAEFRKNNEVVVPPEERTVKATADLLRELGYPDELYAAEPPGGLEPAPS